MYSLHQFKLLPFAIKIDSLNQNGVPLNIGYTSKSITGQFFAYNDFYVELIIAKYSEEMLAIKSFKNNKRLLPYLSQVDISEITNLLALSK